MFRLGNKKQHPSVIILSRTAWEMWEACGVKISATKYTVKLRPSRQSCPTVRRYCLRVKRRKRDCLLSAPTLTVGMERWRNRIYPPALQYLCYENAFFSWPTQSFMRCSVKSPWLSSSSGKPTKRPSTTALEALKW